MWSLYETGAEKDNFLKPLVFSNNKTQEDIVKETLEAVKQGNKIIFIHGVCGSGKSVIALNIARAIGKASIVVPVKSLQKQYEDDYTNKKFLLKENKEKLKISIITGRKNFSCPYIKEAIISSSSPTENNSTLNMFSGNQKGNQKNKADYSKEDSCDNSFLPCKIEIKRNNEETIRDYLKKNKNIKSQFLDLKEVRRFSIAPICPYWSPVVPSELILQLENASVKKYKGLKNIIFDIYQRKKGCGYYEQFQSYVDSDAIIFNSEKYRLESLMNRKPATEIEIIDECDEFLDNFANYEIINLNRLSFAMSSVFSDNEKHQKVINEIIELTSQILKDSKISEHIRAEEILKIKDTKIFQLFNHFLNSSLMNYAECDEENYAYHCDEVARVFETLLDEAYVSFAREERDIVVKIVTTNLEKRFKEMLDKNKLFVMMSGTLHSAKVLKEIFGINDFKIIEAETKMPGKITKLRTGLEINCKYENFKNKSVTREQYLLALNKCIQQAVKPALVHVVSFNDLPSEAEVNAYSLELMSREKLMEMQFNDKLGDNVKKFKNKEIDVLYSTKCNRGADFPGDICNSIILTKYPYPNVSSLFWKILKRTKPEYYNDFYRDKSKRELLQRIYRGLRSASDHIYLLSPDLRVFYEKV